LPSCSGMLQYDAVCCSVLQCVVVCCRVLQGVAVCCSVLQCVAVCCSVCGGGLSTLDHLPSCSCMLQCVAVCCSVLQCVAVSMREISPHYRPFAVLLRYAVVECTSSLQIFVSLVQNTGLFCPETRALLSY